MMTEYQGVFQAHLADIVSVFMVLLILSGRREARSTLVWLLLVVFLPWVGAFLYLFFGRLRPGYKTHKIHPAVPAIDKTSHWTAKPSPRTLLTEKLSGVASVRCTSLELLESAGEKYDRLFQDIALARESVFLCYYVFRRDQTGKRLLELLARKAEEGVSVYLICDGWGAFGLFATGGLRPYIRRGVRAVPFAPVANPLRMSRINFRNHRKIAVIDGTIGYTGSTNIGDEYLGLNPRFGVWRDMHLRVTGESAAVLEEVFAEDWRIATGHLLHLPVRAAVGSLPIHVLPTGPDIEVDRLFPLLFAQLGEAKRTIDIATPYLVPNQSLVAALSVAAQRGVRVRVILPKRSNHPMVAAAGRSYYDELLDGGVEILQLKQGMLHAKAVVVDSEWALLGSANFDNRSFFLNFEINIAIEDPTFITKVEAFLDRLARDSETTDRHTLAARPMPLKLVDSVCRTLSPVL